MKPLSPRVILVLVLLLFLLPLVLAILAFRGTLPLSPTETQNRGALVIPPEPLEWNGFERYGPEPNGSRLRGNWVILYIVRDPCDALCLEEITELRQVHRALGRNQGRVGLALLVDTVNPKASRKDFLSIYPAFSIISASTEASRDAIARARMITTPDARRLLVDPLGQIMMAYNESQQGADLSKDLKRLLKWSKLDGNQG